MTVPAAREDMASRRLHQDALIHLGAVVRSRPCALDCTRSFVLLFAVNHAAALPTVPLPLCA